MLDSHLKATEAPTIGVRTEIRAISFVEPFAAYLRLRERFGAAGAYLLESLSGPVADQQTAIVGFRPLITIELHKTRLRVTGEPRLVGTILDELDRQEAVRIVGGERVVDERGGIWLLLRAVQGRFTVNHPDPKMSYAFGFFGYLGYDTVRFIEKLPFKIDQTDAAPDVALVLFEGVVKFELTTGNAQVVCARSDYWTASPIDEIASQLREAVDAPNEIVPATLDPVSVTDSITPDQYYDNVRQALHHIGIGDIYQVQLGHQLTIRSAVDPLVVYRRLRARNPAPYMYLAQLGSATLIGASPEVFLKIEGPTITMRPLAGTTRRGRTELEDRAAAAALRSDKKEVAEHVMLVDLCRNDIGRICLPKTLEVTELLATEAYSHVFHLVSNVVGALASEADAYDAIAATFPAGTMTGAPKVRAMEIIEELENSRRGIYAGAVGLIDFSGYVNLALCIRTAMRRGDDYVIRASAGIVADSTPEQEWRETIAKLGATYWAIAGKELVP